MTIELTCEDFHWVLQRVAVCCSVLQCMQCVAVCVCVCMQLCELTIELISEDFCWVLQCVEVRGSASWCNVFGSGRSVLQYVAVCCSVK